MYLCITGVFPSPKLSCREVVLTTNFHFKTMSISSPEEPFTEVKQTRNLHVENSTSFSLLKTFNLWHLWQETSMLKTLPHSPFSLLKHLTTDKKRSCWKLYTSFLKTFNLWQETLMLKTLPHFLSWKHVTSESDKKLPCWKLPHFLS